MSPALPRRISSSIIRYVPGAGRDPLGRWSKKRRVSRTAEHAMLLVHEFGRFGQRRRFARCEQRRTADTRNEIAQQRIPELCIREALRIRMVFEFSVLESSW
jgi:hypothetical protein